MQLNTQAPLRCPVTESAARAAILECIQHLRAHPTELEASQLLMQARTNYKAARACARWNSADKSYGPGRVAVFGWELSCNSAGRAETLANVYSVFTHVELIGGLIYDQRIWEPIANTPLTHHSFFTDEHRVLDQVLDFVLAHPYDFVHLSKPRSTTVLAGALYKVIWGAEVVMDVDDEELGMVGAESPLELTDYLKDNGLPSGKLDSQTWTRIAVGMASDFDGVTVSNKPLQGRYGGNIVPHARDPELFVVAPATRAKMRRDLRASIGIAPDHKVVLFFGTPRRHKGLLVTAKAILALNRDDVYFVIVGTFCEPELLAELKALPGLKLVNLLNQPISFAPAVLSIADCTLLMQERNDLVAKFQSPAKVGDALAMNVPVIATLTGPLEPLAAAGAIWIADESNLTEKLELILGNGQDVARMRELGQAYFQEKLTLEAHVPYLTQLTCSAASPLKISPKVALLVSTAWPALSLVSQVPVTAAIAPLSLWGRLRRLAA